MKTLRTVAAMVPSDAWHKENGFKIIDDPAPGNGWHEEAVTEWFREMAEGEDGETG